MNSKLVATQKHKFKIVFAASALVMAGNVQAAPCALGSYANSTVLSPNYNVEWDVCGNNELQMRLTVNTTAWIGVGFSPNPSMPQSDIFMGGVNPDSSAYGVDAFALGNYQPPTDASQDFNILSATELGGVTTMEIRRLLNTGDSADYDLGTGSYYLLWSYGRSDTFGYHQARGASTDQYSFTPAAVPVPAAMPLLLSGLGLLGLYGKRKSQK